MKVILPSKLLRMYIYNELLDVTNLLPCHEIHYNEVYPYKSARALSNSYFRIRYFVHCDWLGMCRGLSHWLKN